MTRKACCFFSLSVDWFLLLLLLSLFWCFFLFGLVFLGGGVIFFVCFVVFFPRLLTFIHICVVEQPVRLKNSALYTEIQLSL